MQIKLTHPHYQLLTQTNEGLTLHGDAAVPLYPGQVEECAVTISNNMIHTAALLTNNTILHWHGNQEMLFYEIDTETQPIRGLKLITDSRGVPHLFYLQQNLKQTGYVLIQHTFDAGSWSDPVRVTSNISSEPQHWQLCYDAEQALHLVYLSQERDTLLYRVGDMQKKIWSGAIPIVQEPTDSPQMFAFDQKLVIFWIGLSEQGRVLRAVMRQDFWSKPFDLSPVTKDIFQPGIELGRDGINIVWTQSSKLWRTSYQQEWSAPELLDIGEYESGYQTILADNEGNNGCCVMRVYFRKASVPQVSIEEQEPETKPAAPEPKSEAKAEPAPIEQARREAERRFFAEAFQLHQEWQSVKEQYTKVLEEKEKLAQEIEQQLLSRLQVLADQAAAKHAEEISLLSQRIQVVRDDIRSLKMRQVPRRSSQEFDALQARIDKIETSLRSKVSESQLAEIRTRIAKLETKSNPQPTYSQPEQPQRKPRRTLIQKILSRL